MTRAARGTTNYSTGRSSTLRKNPARQSQRARNCETADRCVEQQSGSWPSAEPRSARADTHHGDANDSVPWQAARYLDSKINVALRHGRRARHDLQAADMSDARPVPRRAKKDFPKHSGSTENPSRQIT